MRLIPAPAMCNPSVSIAQQSPSSIPPLVGRIRTHARVSCRNEKHDDVPLDK